jgi:hypothetical protein
MADLRVAGVATRVELRAGLEGHRFPPEDPGFETDASRSHVVASLTLGMTPV